jgi:8-oxo-dGTP pyrophosphatase MutT (NUDIX family)
MTPLASAEKEAWEEAGIRGEVGKCSLGIYSHRNWAGRFKVEVFPMRVAAELDEWPERSVRRREWVSIEESLRRLRNQDVCEIVRRLPSAVS